MDPKTREEHEDWYRKAAATGITLNAGRGSKLHHKRHAPATRLQAREDDCLRFARDLRIPFTNNPAEQVIRMSKLRIKVSGCMRSMKGAETFRAIRSRLATAARHGITRLGALTRATEGNPWIPGTT
jgi:transposase